MEEWTIKKSKSDMFNKILKFKKERKIQGYSIFQVVMMYCEELDEDIDEVGELLKKDKAFLTTLKEDMKFNNEATFKGDPVNKNAEWL